MQYICTGLRHDHIVQITHKFPYALGLRSEDAQPIVAAEGLHIDKVVGGDVTVLADVGDDCLEVFFLVRIEGGVGEEVSVALRCLFPVDADDGTDEGGHNVAA